MSRSDLNISRWLDAHCDRSAGLKILQNNITLADIVGDDDYKLVLTDIKLAKDTKSRLKIYKGTILSTDQTLPEIPSGVISFYMEDGDFNVPVIGIACGVDLLIYKNYKPFFKFSTPSLPILAAELEAWRTFATGNNTQSDILNIIENLKKETFNLLSARTQRLLSLKTDECPAYIDKYKNIDISRVSPITCVTNIWKNSFEKKAVSCPVIATECGQVYILDPQNFSILHQAAASSSTVTPSFIKCSGALDVEFRIVIATREGYICLLRRGWLEGKKLFHISSYITDFMIIPGENSIVVATSNKLLISYSKKGNKMWSIEMKHEICCLCLIPLKHLSTTLLAAGLKGGSIQLLQGRNVVDYISTPGTPSAMTFGQMGQEEHVLIVITDTGILDIKILKRTADFNFNHQESSTGNNLHSKPLPLPKRSKLFLEQNSRERQNAIQMHQHFQQDLIRIRLNAARALVHNNLDQARIGNEKEMVKLSAQVIGLGPKFTLIVNLENMNANKALSNLILVYHCTPKVYKLTSYIIHIPLIPPGLVHKTETNIEVFNNINCQMQSTETVNNIKVFCIKENQAQPVLAATITMPTSDTNFVVL